MNQVKARDFRVLRLTGFRGTCHAARPAVRGTPGINSASRTRPARPRTRPRETQGFRALLALWSGWSGSRTDGPSRRAGRFRRG